MTDLIEFLRARLAEDEAVAQAADAKLSRVLDQVEYSDSATDADERHIARHDPARVLAEVGAKRRVIGNHVADKKGNCRTCAHWTSDWVDGFKVDRLAYEGVRAPCLTLRLLALPFADHPDYREEWRP